LTSETTGYLYQAALRAEPTDRLRVRWHEVERGTADVVVVPRGVIEHFSRLRAEIFAHMAARGESSARAAQVATLETRRRKDYAVPPSRLREEWQARPAEHGLSHFRARRVLGRAPRRVSDVGGFEDVAIRLAGPEGLTRESSTFTRRDVVQAFAESAGAGAPVVAIEVQADAFLTRRAVIELEAVSGERRFTTGELPAIERELLDSPTFPNQAPEPLRDGDVPLHVARMLEDSSAEHLALDRAAHRTRSRDDGLGLGR